MVLIVLITVISRTAEWLAEIFHIEEYVLAAYEDMQRTLRDVSPDRIVDLYASALSGQPEQPFDVPVGDWMHDLTQIFVTFFWGHRACQRRDHDVVHYYERILGSRRRRVPPVDNAREFRTITPFIIGISDIQLFVGATALSIKLDPEDGCLHVLLRTNEPPAEPCQDPTSEQSLCGSLSMLLRKSRASYRQPNEELDL